MSKETVLLNKDLQKEPFFQKLLHPAFFLGIIVFIGVALRLYDLNTESFWIDEMSTVVEGQQNIFQLITSGRLDQPPAYYLPFHLWLQVFGVTEISTRLFSALVGVGSIILIYIIGRELFTKEIGLLAAFLMAISEFQIYYSQQARFYSYFEFATLLSFLFFLKVLKDKRKIDFVSYAAASIFMVYSHAFGVFVLVGQGLFFIFEWKKYRNILFPWFISQVVIFLLILPYFFPMVFGNGLGGAVGENIGGLAVPAWQDPVRSLYRFVFSARRERSWNNIIFNYAFAILWLVIGTLVFALRKGLRNFFETAMKRLVDVQNLPDVKETLLLVILWLICPIFLPFILSRLVSPMYLDRYTISAAPALYLLLALGMYSIRKVVPTLITLGVFAIVIAPGLGYYYAADLQEQWREASAYVEQNSTPRDVIVFAPNLGIGIQEKTFDWYYKGHLPECGLGLELLDSAAISKAFSNCASSEDRAWVIIRDNSTEPSRRYTSYFLDPKLSNLHLVKDQHFVEISVYLFDIARP